MDKEQMIELLRAQNRGIFAMVRILRDMQKRNEKILGAVNRGDLLFEDGGTVLPVTKTAEQVIRYLNDLTGRSFDPRAYNTLQLIRNLLEQNRTEEDLMLVVELKCREWDGTEFQQYLRPETLFGEHFESYLVEAQVNAVKHCRPGRHPIEGLEQLHRMKMQQYQSEIKEQQEALCYK